MQVGKALITALTSWLRRFVNHPYGRRSASALFRFSIRRRLTPLDTQTVSRCQRKSLLGLIHQARATQFGKDHDFPRIRTVADFHRLVPLSTIEQLASEYWKPAYPDLNGATWPGPLSLHSSGLPASCELTPGQRITWETAFALVGHSQGWPPMLQGDLLVLSDNTELVPQQLPRLLRSHAHVVVPENLHDPALAATSFTCLAGPLDLLHFFCARMKCLTGKDRIEEIWPDLKAILYTRDPAADLGTIPTQAPVALLREEVSEHVTVLERMARPEGIFAVEDPRPDLSGLLRLLPDAGSFYELIPVSDRHQEAPPRLGLEEMEPGVPYELVVSSPAGLWATRVGMGLCFQERESLLFQLTELPALPEVTTRLDQVTPASHSKTHTPLPSSLPVTGPMAPHRQNADIPAMPGEMFDHSLWSATWDRG